MEVKISVSDPNHLSRNKPWKFWTGDALQYDAMHNLKCEKKYKQTNNFLIYFRLLRIGNIKCKYR